MNKAWKKVYDSAIQKLGGDEYDAIAMRSFRLGEVAAMEAVGPTLRKDAGEAFANGKDERAAWLRELAQIYDQRANELRATYQREFHED